MAGVLVAGLVLAGLVGVLVAGLPGAAPLPLVVPPVFPIGVADGVDGGSDTIGVGSGGSGFESTLAIN